MKVKFPLPAGWSIIRVDPARLTEILRRTSQQQWIEMYKRSDKNPAPPTGKWIGGRR